MTTQKFSRRDFLHTGAVATGGVLVGTYPQFRATAHAPVTVESMATSELHSFALAQDWMLQALEPGLMEIRDRCRALDSTLQEFTSIDPSTGQIGIVDEASIQAAFLEFVRDDNKAQRSSQWYQRLAEGGMMIPGPEASDADFVSMPWRALTHRMTLEHMHQGSWKAVGVEPWLTSNLAAERLQARFGNVPDYILEPERLESFVAYAAREAWFDSISPRGLNPLAMRMPDQDGGRDFGIDDADIDRNPPPPRKPAEVVFDWLEKLGSEAVQCLLGAEWSGDVVGTGWFSILRSVTICMDVTCADKLRKALVSGATGPITAGLKVAVAAGATISGIVAAAGGWVALGIALGAAWWALQISLALRSNPSKVCIVNYAPWWPHLVPMYAYGE